jgi:hypothetical protein
MSSFPRPRRSAACQLAALAATLASYAVLGACTVQGGVPAPAPAIGAAVVLPGSAVVLTAVEPPPPLPVYEQPPCPEDGYVWTPGNWQRGSAGYFWVPGTWVQPPQVGVFWTPGYWGYADGAYGFHAGYWAAHIGFYGGVNYGFGYGGSGFVGGRWDGGSYEYNTSVSNVDVAKVHNTYNQTVEYDNVNVNNASYNGGAAGVTAVPTARDRAVAQEAHIAPTPAQSAHILAASRRPELAAKNNRGYPAVAATVRPDTFSGPGVMGSRRPMPAKVTETKDASRPTAHSGAAAREAGGRDAQVGSTERAEAPLPQVKELAVAPDARKPPDGAPAPKAATAAPQRPEPTPAKAEPAGKAKAVDPHDETSP